MDSLANKFKTIRHDERACAVEIKYGEKVLLCINAYLSNDTVSAGLNYFKDATCMLDLATG